MYENKKQKITCAEALPDTFLKSHNNMVVLKKKKYHEALDILDLKLIDVKKKTDLIRHDINQKRSKLNDLFEKWSDLRSKISYAMSRDLNTAKSLSVLENRSHQVDMSRMEASHVTRKYRSIRNQLLDDSVLFDSILDKLEKSIANQQKEIHRLEKINEEAVQARDKTRNTLQKKEINATNIAKFRMRQVEQIRAKVEERKLELERLERKIFPPGQKLSRHDSIHSSCDEQRLVGNESSDNQEVSDSTYIRLKQITGSIDSEDIRKKFVSQKETKERLSALKFNTEKEKQSLQITYQKLSEEFEQCRFSNAQEKEQNEEERDNLKQQILEETNKLSHRQRDGSQLSNQINQVLLRLYNLCLILKDVDSAPVPDKCPSIDKGDWLICLLQTKYESIIKNKGVRNIKTELDDVNLDKIQLWSLDENNLEVANKEEEEKLVSNRSIIKKQAQVILDSKTKKKGLRIKKGNL
ncbi:outer dynein arm-docking complex subunit 3-like [Daktulosphaira vitifoliae]|uniref:outer dynein arm-docking complex subunit 3-like n=1 Tax=Daktulosphaira vitifoliae TaxID=58002 RepID=UPI0021AA9160|nr:outer dynein arm-docking complex subunit 3-like [Daktulosphaira vitifoliae]